MEEEKPDISKDVEPKARTIPSECKICGASALYKYFGAISCHACKIFFKRNALFGLETFKCSLNGDCEINMNSRHICTYCRLQKCFTNGMQIELIRCSRKSNTRKSRSIKSNTTNEQFQLPTISNLLNSKHFELNLDQRNLLLSLNQYCEEHNILSYVQQFLQEQTSLPIKLRHKMASWDVLFGSILHGIGLFFKLNNNFVSLCSDDPSNLLRYAMENAGSATVALVLREIPLFDYPEMTELVSINLTKYLPKEIACDVTFIQLSIAMFVFSITNCTGYSDNGLEQLISRQDIFRIQGLYAEVTWKYLLYKYDYTQAVICFISFVKSLLLINHVIIEIHQSEQHKRMIGNLIEKINQQVVLNR